MDVIRNTAVLQVQQLTASVHVAVRVVASKNRIQQYSACCVTQQGIYTGTAVNKTGTSTPFCVGQVTCCAAVTTEGVPIG